MYDCQLQNLCSCSNYCNCSFRVEYHDSPTSGKQIPKDLEQETLTGSITIAFQRIHVLTNKTDRSYSIHACILCCVCTQVKPLSIIISALDVIYRKVLMLNMTVLYTTEPWKRTLLLDVELVPVNTKILISPTNVFCKFQPTSNSMLLCYLQRFCYMSVCLSYFQNRSAFKWHKQ